MTLIISGLGSEQTISLYPDNNNLEFKYDISLQPTLGFEFGTYTINASYGQWTAGTSFMLVEEQMQAIEDTTKFLQVSADSSHLQSRSDCYDVRFYECIRPITKIIVNKMLCLKSWLTCTFIGFMTTLDTYSTL